MKSFLLILLLGAHFLWAGQQWFVDNEAHSSGDGSYAHPFTTISEGLQHLQPGDTLLIRGNTDHSFRVYQESLYLSRSMPSGTADAPIVVRAYPGESVKIIPEKSVSVYVNFWVFLHLTFDMDGQPYDLIKLRADHNTFRNCEFTNGQRDGFDISGASNTLIENCRIHYFVRNDHYDAHGIILNGGVDNVIRGNTIYDCKGDCIQLYKADQNYGTVIENNDLYTTLGANSENAIDVKAARNLIIRNNKMHGFHRAEDSDGVALKINKDTDNTFVFGNDIFESNGGIRVSGDEVDSIRIERNVIHDLHVDEGDSSKYGYGIQLDGVNDLQFLNNTMANIPGPLFWIASRGAHRVIIENNLFYRGHRFKGSSKDLTDPLKIDYNGWFDCEERLSGPHDTIGNDPAFADPSAYDYRLKKHSPAIDRGDPDFGSNYPGGRIDLGAFEFETATGLIHNTSDPLRHYHLLKAYPNPFNPQTTIAFTIKQSGPVRLDVFNVLGQKIDTLLKAQRTPGNYALNWHPTGLPAGLYFVRLQTSHISETYALLLLR